MKSKILSEDGVKFASIDSKHLFVCKSPFTEQRKLFLVVDTMIFDVLHYYWLAYLKSI